MRTIKRRWFSKKENKWVTREYFYTNTKFYQLTTKKGKKTKKATEAYIRQLAGGDISKELFIRSTIRDYQIQKKKLTARMVNAMFSQNQLDIFMANLNITYEQIQRDLEEQGIDVNITYLMNPDNWSFIKGTMDAELLLSNGSTVSFTFDYYEGYTLNV